jgi:hypothetical protein
MLSSRLRTKLEYTKGTKRHFTTLHLIIRDSYNTSIFRKAAIEESGK